VYVLFITIRNHILSIKDLFWFYMRWWQNCDLLQTLALKTDRHKQEGLNKRAWTVLLHSCTQTRRQITNCFHHKSRCINKYIFTDVYLCTCTYESSDIGSSEKHALYLVDEYHQIKMALTFHAILQKDFIFHSGKVRFMFKSINDETIIGNICELNNCT